MTSRGSGYQGVAALDALAREYARAPVPPLDWDRVEQRLFAAVEEAERVAALAPAPAPAARKSGSPWGVALAAAAVVAVVHLAPHGGAHESAPAPSRAVLSAAPGTETLSAPLARGDVAQAGAEPIRYEARGAVTFTIAPSSRVKVLSEATGPTMTVALLEGSIHAEVVPHPNGEVFAVEVGQTRVAAHGTSFTVSREGDRVVVEIAHGSVAVGPAGHPGSTHGWLLVGPDKASFSLDGATDATWLGQPPPTGEAAIVEETAAESASAAPEPSLASAESRAADSSESAAPAVRPARHAAADAAASRPRARAARPTADGAAADGADHRAAVAGILARLNACYERQVASFGVRFSIRSSLTLTVSQNGTVREGVFDPPLSPTLMTCARDAISAARFPQDSAPVVRVPVVLSPSP